LFFTKTAPRFPRVTIIFLTDIFFDRVLANLGISEFLSLNSYLNSLSLITSVFTFLYLKTLEKSNESDTEILKQLFSSFPKDPTEKIEQVKELYLKSGAAKESLQEIVNYTQNANNIIEQLNISDKNKAVLKSFSDQLMNRKV